MNDAHEVEHQIKKEYAAPELVVYGDVGSLTQAGVGSTVEGPGGGTTIKKP